MQTTHLPNIRRKEDGEDIAESFASNIDVEKVSEMINRVLEKYSEYREILARNIGIVNNENSISRY